MLLSRKVAVKEERSARNALSEMEVKELLGSVDEVWIARGKKVEKLAGWTVAEVKEKLELKKQGKCTCGAKDANCKTLCGTLLGSNAKDSVVGEKRGEFGSKSKDKQK